MLHMGVTYLPPSQPYPRNSFTDGDSTMAQDRAYRPLSDLFGALFLGVE
ncbi:hypothetical protein ACVWZA_001912 [Sphingomonas sp. UYAg733]